MNAQMQNSALRQVFASGTSLISQNMEIFFINFAILKGEKFWGFPFILNAI